MPKPLPPAHFPLTGDIVVVRGGGDLATGVVQKLVHAGLRVVVLEIARPTVIRRTVALAPAAVEGEARVEDVTCRHTTPDGLAACWAEGVVPLLIDPPGDCIAALRPHALVDAIIAKRNLGTHRGMAPITIAMGPGFTAPGDVDCVVETMRGHDLGRLILEGAAQPDTGVPGLVQGKSAERVVHAPVAGTVRHVRQIGDVVRADETIFTIDDTPVPATMDGLLRGLIADGIQVPQGMKTADIGPRPDIDCHTISDKARCLGGAVLDAYLYLRRNVEPAAHL